MDEQKVAELNALVAESQKTLSDMESRLKIITGFFSRGDAHLKKIGLIPGMTRTSLW